jgi:DNA processing protein
VDAAPNGLAIEPGSALWPFELETIEAPPSALWLRGREALLLPDPARPRVAIVGTRAPTPYGYAQAQRFATCLGRAGVIVISGLARGIDQAAHAAALEAGAGTIAVLGSGVDRPWPAGELSERIARDGLLLSEFAPGERPRRHHFPLRNRLISGLSAAVLVVEAARASGSLITARWAADQGRAVYALPGRVDHPMAGGCHRLLREGATLVEDPLEILADLGLAGGEAAGAQPRALPFGSARPSPTPLAHAPLPPLLEHLRGETLSADELAERCGRELPGVLAELVEHELAGRVHRRPGALYQLAQRARRG